MWTSDKAMTFLRDVKFLLHSTLVGLLSTVGVSSSVHEEVPRVIGSTSQVLQRF